MGLTREFVEQMNLEIKGETFGIDTLKYNMKESDEFAPLVYVWRLEEDPNYLIDNDEEGNWFTLMNETEFIAYCQELLTYHHDCDFQGTVFTIDQLKECIREVFDLDYDGPVWDYTINAPEGGY